MTRPNIYDGDEKHEHRANCSLAEIFDTPGDVRFCPHGKLQLVKSAFGGGRYWKTLSLFDDFRLYLKAWKVMRKYVQIT